MSCITGRTIKMAIMLSAACHSEGFHDRLKLPFRGREGDTPSHAKLKHAEASCEISIQAFATVQI